MTQTTLWQKIKWFFSAIFEPSPPSDFQIMKEMWGGYDDEEY